MKDVIISGRFASLGIYNELLHSDYEKAYEIMKFLHCGHLADSPYGVFS